MEETVRKRAISLAEAIGELEHVVTECQVLYAQAPSEGPQRRNIARRMVALDMGRQALAATMELEARK